MLSQNFLYCFICHINKIYIFAHIFLYRKDSLIELLI